MVIECLVRNSATSRLSPGAGAGDPMFDTEDEGLSEVKRGVASSGTDRFLLSFFKSDDWVSSSASSPLSRFRFFFFLSVVEAIQFI